MISYIRKEGKLSRTGGTDVTKAGDKAGLVIKRQD